MHLEKTHIIQIGSTMNKKTGKKINTRSAMKNLAETCSTVLLNMVGKALEPLSNTIEKRVEGIFKAAKPSYEVDFSDHLKINASSTVKS